MSIENTTTNISLEPVIKLSRDIALAAKTLSDSEARYLVDSYYMLQEMRIRSNNQIKAMAEAEEPNEALKWFYDNFELLENQIKRALDKYSDGNELAAWAKSQMGIGPVIAAGLASNIGDVTRFQAVGNLYSYCGLAPSQKRKRGEKSNWNQSLKRLAWIIGESFVKVSGKDESLYGRLYKEKKAYYEAKNDAGGFAERAAQCLQEKKYSKDTDAYKAYSAGRLPKAHIHEMAKRHAAKIFISHFHEMGYRMKGLEPPKCYAIAILGHVHEVKPMNR